MRNVCSYQEVVELPPGLWADGLNLVSDQGKCLISRKWTSGKENAGNDAGRAQVQGKSR